jgi:hypothetical protein
MTRPCRTTRSIDDNDAHLLQARPNPVAGGPVSCGARRVALGHQQIDGRIQV